ncbi:MAG: phosphatase [Bacteroidota bacterium]|nr:phosphatase [Bacteroidota bacterium]
MRIAIIDLGTNTFNLLICDKKGENKKTIFKNKIAVKLGEGGIDKGIIANTPYQRGIKALEDHLKTIKKYDVDKVKAFATSAIRSTKNGVDFVSEVFEKLALKIEVIDGDKEAELIYQGVRKAIPIDLDYMLIMDIGGGSTEFIIANAEGVQWKKSYLLGVSRLKELFKPKDPITQEEIQTIENHLKSELKDLIKNIQTFPCKTLIGSSGSFDTLVEMIGFKFNNLELKNKKPSCNILLEHYKWAQDFLIQSTLSERLNTKGIVTMRADMIVLSVIFINFVLREFDIKEMIRSKYALKEGAMHYYF